ncbi:MAG TPA: T9SS type A sorting domain-containing protein [Bacteroidetes bacterium]|nr:T9SS type A sorting domain-containing protein [Bacteroidota bacterium]
MNIIKNLLLFISFSFFLTSSVELSSQCGINGIDISNIQCVENATYEFDLNLIVTDGSLDSFKVLINNNFQGQYSPDDLPIHIINSFFSGNESDIIRIEDIFNEDCFDEAEVNNPCGCALFDYSYSKLHCNDSTFNIIFDFKYFNTEDSFDIGMINSPFGTHSYKDLPLEIGPFYIADTTYLLNIFDNAPLSFCFLEMPIPADSCTTCNIHDIELLSYECDDDFNKYIDFVFEYNNPSSEKYNIFVNNKFYKTNDYLFQNIMDSTAIQDTFHIGPIDIRCDSILRLKIEDSENPQCNSLFEIDSICCANCEIGEIKVRDKKYTGDSKLGFILDFDYYRNRTDSFELSSSNGMVRKYSTKDLPVMITDYSVGENDFDTLTICMDNGNCCNSVILEFPQCEIGELKFRDKKCTSDSTFDFFLNFNYARNRSDSFKLISSNGLKSKYSLKNLPLHIQNYPVGESGFDSLTVCIDNNKCCSHGLLEFPDCTNFDCNITDINFEILYDTIESYWVILNFDNENTSDSFQIKGNGIDYGHFSYNELPVKLGPYNCSDSLLLEYVIKDLELEGCKNVIEPGMVQCPPNDVLNITAGSNYIISYLMNSKILKIDSEKIFTGNASISVYNIYGQKVKQYKLPKGTNHAQFNLDINNTGIYFVKMKNGSESKGKKIFVENRL